MHVLKELKCDTRDATQEAIVVRHTRQTTRARDIHKSCAVSCTLHTNRQIPLQMHFMFSHFALHITTFQVCDSESIRRELMSD